MCFVVIKIEGDLICVGYWCLIIVIDECLKYVGCFFVWVEVYDIFCNGKVVRVGNFVEKIENEVKNFMMEVMFLYDVYVDVKCVVY